MIARMILGLGLTAIAFAVAGRRLWWLKRLALSGQPVITFTVIRLRNDPHKEGRKSRFFGSHTRAAWVMLGMIAAVMITLAS